MCIVGLVVGAAVADKLGVMQCYLVSGTTPVDSTYVLGNNTGQFSCFAYGDTVAFQLYNKRGVFIATVTVPDGASISFTDGPVISKVTINRPATAPLAVFTALQ